MNKGDRSKLDFLVLIVKWRKFFIINFIIVSILSAGVSLILPQWYVGNVTILPPVEEQSDLGLSSMISGLSFGSLGLGGASFEANIVIAILQSRSLLESVAKKFSLQERYEADDMEETLRMLKKRIVYKLHEEGTITIFSRTKTKHFPGKSAINEARYLARDMASFATAKLDSINKTIRLTKAFNTRSFIERRYNQNLDDLKKAEEDFRAFQEKYGAIALPEQTLATIEALAALKSQQVAKEIELGVLENYYDSSHIDVQRAKTEIREIQRKLEDYQQSSQIDGKKDGDMKLFLPLDEIPEMGIEYARLLREIKMQELILEFITPQYEQARIQESKDTSTIQILDEAVVPIKRIKPKRAFFVIFMNIVMFMVGVVFIFVVEYLQQIQRGERDKQDQLAQIVDMLATDLKRASRLFRKRA
ncbi:hypothetical protein EH223_16550 [candidate division KSB1 bacterium]|nr:hypothetical protein [candidate division KSB1 bacterium]RQW00957.1 MAG: hypothetical protein EH223_16550 [candidate division KSB1 bacterium]